MADIRTHTVTHEDDSFIYGETRDNGVLVTKTIRSKDSHWLTGTSVDICKSIGLTLDNQRAKELLDIVDCNINGLYWLSSAKGKTNGLEMVKWVMSGITVELKNRGFDFSRINDIIRPDEMSYFIECIETGKINRTFAKDIFNEILGIQTDHTYKVTIDSIINNPRYVAVDNSELIKILDDVIHNNMDQYEKLKSEPKLINWFVGQVMKASKGKANATEVTNLIKDKVNG